MRAAGLDCSIADGLKEGLGAAELAERLKDADIVGISCLSGYFPETAALAEKLKSMGKFVVAGGPQATVLPLETLAHSAADCVVTGEGEKTFPELVRRFAASGSAPDNMPGVVTRKTERPERAPLIQDLDSLPFPAWDQMSPSSYPPAPHGGVVKAFPVAAVSSSRGCPFSCSFCASPEIWGRKIRFRSPQNVVDEIEMLVRDYHVREIHFEDDNLTLKESHAAGVCHEIIKRGLKIFWAAPNGIRVDAISPELLRLMKKSGCYSLAFGIESGSPEILGNVSKQIDPEKICRAVRMAHEEGIMTQAFIIFGLPGENLKTIEETMRLVMSLPLDKAQFLLLDLLPGSELWKKHGTFSPEYFKKRSYQEPGFIPDGLDAETLKRARSAAFRRFYLRPGKLLRMLSMIKPSQISYVARRVRDFEIFGGRR
jgi:radical SAM superfamily enzyme YgiQ (UPF0313 family)